MIEILQKAYEARSKKLNKIEKLKEKRNAKEAYEAIKEYAKSGYESIVDEDLNFFLKGFGIYDKKKVDGDNSFMIRVRIPAGRLSITQAETIAKIAKEYCKDYIDITTRQQVEIRYIKIEDIPTILEKLESVGITTFQTGVDNIRNIVTDALDGVAYDSVIETYPIIEKLQNIFLKNYDYISTLPRKFNTAINGSFSNSCNIYGHDCSFILANKDGRFGFNVYLGGKVGVQAKCANLFVTEENIELFYKTLIDTFKEYGFRDNRNKNRLFYLIEAVGMENFISAIKEKAGEEFEEAGEVMVNLKQPTTTSKVMLKNGKFAHKVVVPSGIISGSELLELCEKAKENGSDRLRLSYDQNIYVLDVDSDFSHDFKKYNNIFFNDMIACAGTKTCVFGVIPNKSDAIELAEYLKSEVKIDSGKVRMNWSACVKGCGVHGIADIGFEGCKAKDKDGNKVDGVHIFLGGKVTKEAKEAHTLIKSVPLTTAKYYVKYLLLAYSKLKLKNESFEEFETRVLSKYSYQAIVFYMLINYVHQSLGLDLFELKANPTTAKNEAYEIFEFGLNLYKQYTGESRYEAVVDYEPVIDKKIKPDSIKTVPAKLSEIIYKMTIADKTKRYKVFSEFSEDLKDLV